MHCSKRALIDKYYSYNGTLLVQRRVLASGTSHPSEAEGTEGNESVEV